MTLPSQAIIFKGSVDPADDTGVFEIPLEDEVITLTRGQAAPLSQDRIRAVEDAFEAYPDFEYEIVDDYDPDASTTADPGEVVTAVGEGEGELEGDEDENQ